MNTSLGICFWARDAGISLTDDPQLYKYCAMVFANQNEEGKKYWKLSEKVKIKLSDRLSLHVSVILINEMYLSKRPCNKDSKSST